MGKQAKVLTHWYRLLEYSASTYEFEIEKCNILNLKRGIKDKNCDIMFPNNLKISSLKGGERKCQSWISEAHQKGSWGKR